MENLTTSIKEKIKQKNQKPLSRKQLETIVGGPETSRGTKTRIDD